MSDTTRISYEFVPGFFVHDLVAEQPPLPAVPPRFGLIDTSNDRWTKFEAQIRRLNQDSPIGTTYKFFLLSRHGQGYHNVAEAKYGTLAWDEHWSKLNGNGEIIWGPDPQLTSLGIEQAQVIQDMWKTESSYGLAPPHKLYCSPLTRALHTCSIMLDGVFQYNYAPVTILENCREENGVHTCDKRDTRTYIATSYPHFVIEEGFTELDELWHPTIRESKVQVAERARKVLDVIFEKDINALFISITAHGGFIDGFLTAIGRQRFFVPTGGILPVLVKSQAFI
ncbi:phosphoglycerate mutase [Phlegmacium glaucopus]|nr:phosphoglycerate mutase [Phlegmacium glaucopus]